MGNIFDYSFIACLVFVFFYVVVIMAVHFLAKIASIKYNSVSILSVFLAFYFVFAYAGMPLLFYRTFSLELFFQSFDINDSWIAMKTFICSSLCIILTLVGCILAKTTWRRGIRDFNGEAEPLKANTYAYCLGFTLLCLAVLVAFMTQMSNIPILEIFRLDNASFAELVKLRSDADYSVDKAHRYKMFTRQLMPYISFILFGQALVKPKTKYWVSFGVVFAFSVFEYVLTLHKGNVIFYLFSVFSVYLIMRNKLINWRHIVFVLGVTIPIIIVMYAFFMDSLRVGLFETFLGMNNRIFLGQIVPAYFYVEMFPDVHEFLLGRGLPNPGGILPIERYNLTMEVMDYANPGLWEKQLIGSMPTAYWGALYANFGIPGIVTVAPFVGFILYTVQIFAQQFPKSPVSVAFLVWCAFHYLSLATTEIPGYFIFDMEFWLICLVTLILLKAQNKTAVSRLSERSVLSPN